MKKILTALGKALCYALLLVVGQFAAMFAAATGYAAWVSIEPYRTKGVLPAFEPLLQETADFTMRYATVIASAGGLCVLLALWIFFSMRGKRLFTETGWLPNGARQNARAGLCGVCFALGVCAALQTLPIPDALMQSYQEATDEVLGVFHPLVLLCTVVLGPIVEEVVFRGLVFTRLRRAMPLWSAALLSALLFGVMHGNPLWIAYAFCLGCVLAFVYEKGGGLWASVFFHILFNFVGSYVMLPLEASPVLGVAVLLAGLLGGAALLWRMNAEARALTATDQ